MNNINKQIKIKTISNERYENICKEFNKELKNKQNETFMKDKKDDINKEIFLYWR